MADWLTREKVPGRAGEGVEVRVREAHLVRARVKVRVSVRVIE